MRRFIPLGLTTAFLFLMAPSLDAQVAGDWTITYSQMGRQGGQAREVSMDVTFAQDGAEVTGTALMAMRGRGGEAAGEPQEIPLTDVSLEGDKITFTVTRGMGERTMSVVYSGTVAGNEMTGTMTRGGGRGGANPIPFKGVKKEG